MTRFVTALAPAVLLLGLAAPALAADGRPMPPRDEWGQEGIQYCADNAGEWYSEPDEATDIQICRYADGSELWCNADYEDCELFPPNERPGPAGRTPVNVPTTATPGADLGGTAPNGTLLRLPSQR